MVGLSHQARLLGVKSWQIQRRGLRCSLDQGVGRERGFNRAPNPALVTQLRAALPSGLLAPHTLCEACDSAPATHTDTLMLLTEGALSSPNPWRQQATGLPTGQDFWQHFLGRGELSAQGTEHVASRGGGLSSPNPWRQQATGLPTGQDFWQHFLGRRELSA